MNRITVLLSTALLFLILSSCTEDLAPDDNFTFNNKTEVKLDNVMFYNEYLGSFEVGETKKYYLDKGISKDGSTFLYQFSYTLDGDENEISVGTICWTEVRTVDYPEVEIDILKHSTRAYLSLVE